MPAPNDRHRTPDEYAAENLILEVFLDHHPVAEWRCSECDREMWNGEPVSLMVYNDGRLVCYNCERGLDADRERLKYIPRPNS